MSTPPGRRLPSWLRTTAPTRREGDGRPVDSVDRSPGALERMPAWRRRLTHPALLWVVAGAAFAAGQGLLLLLYAAFGESPGTIPSAAAWGPAVAAVLGYALVLLVEQRHPHELVVSPPAQLVRGLGLGVTVGLVAVGALAVLGGITFDYANRGFFYADESGGWPLGLWLVVVLGAAPAVSLTLLLCGVIFRYVEQLLGTWVALLASAGAAAGLQVLGLEETYVTAAGTAGAAVWGLLLVSFYAATRSLWFVVGVHTAWHAVRGPLLGLRAPGTTSPSAAGSSCPSARASSVPAGGRGSRGRSSSSWCVR